MSYRTRTHTVVTTYGRELLEDQKYILRYINSLKITHLMRRSSKVSRLRRTNAFQGRFALAWKKIYPEKNWRKPVLVELMNWDRECWSNRCSNLFGLKKGRYCLHLHRIHLQVNLWYEVPFHEVLILRSSFPEHASNLHKHNEGIVRWLDHQHTIQNSILARTHCPTGQTPILSFRGTPESR